MSTSRDLPTRRLVPLAHDVLAHPHALEAARRSFARARSCSGCAATAMEAAAAELGSAHAHVVDGGGHPNGVVAAALAASALGERRATVAERALAGMLPMRLSKLLVRSEGARSPGLGHREERAEGLRAIEAALRRTDRNAARKVALMRDALLPRPVWALAGDVSAFPRDRIADALDRGKDVNFLFYDTLAGVADPRERAHLGRDLVASDTALLALSRRGAYVAQVTAAQSTARVRGALASATRFAGPSVVILWAHCQACSDALAPGVDHASVAVSAGVFAEFERAPSASPRIRLDVGPRPDVTPRDFLRLSDRWSALERDDPARFAALARHVERSAVDRRRILTALVDARGVEAAPSRPS